MQVYFFLAGSARSLERQPGWMGRGGTRPSKPCNGGPRLSGPWFNVGLSILVPRARQACPSDLPEGPACQVRLSRRDVLVTSDEHRLMTHPPSPGTTSVPLRSLENPSRRNIPRRDLLVRSAVQRSIINSPSPGTTSVPLRFLENLSRRNIPRRDLLVGSAVQRWIIHFLSPGTEVPR